MPEQIIEKIKKCFSSQLKACFVSALIIGLVAHLYKITNWLPNWDGLVFRYDAQNMIALGRWFLPVVCAPSSFYDLPFIAGLMAIIFHGLGAVCICKMFGVRKKITAVLVGALVVSFPTVTSVMTYNYVADGYAIAFLFSCMAAMLITREKPRYVGAVLLITLSAGIYQAYITVTIMLLILFVFFEILNKTAEPKGIVLKIVRFLLTGALGMGLYYFVLTVLLKVTGTELLDYQGLDDATSLNGIDIASALYIIKQLFFEYFFDFSKGINVFPVINIVVFGLAVIYYVTDVVRNKLGVIRILFVCVFVVLLPVGAGILSFINSNIDYHNLMKMGFLVFYLILILQYERADFKCEKMNLVKLWSVLIITSVLICNQVIIANVSYHKLNMAYEKSYGTLIRIVDRIEQAEGAEECDRIMVLGQLPGSEPYSAILPPDITGTTDGYIIRADDEVVGQSVLCSAINDYCGKTYGFLAGEEKTALIEKINAEDMDCWPGKSSVLVADNVIVIKLSDKR